MATKFFISSHFCKLIMQLVYVYLKIVLTFYVLCGKTSPKWHAKNTMDDVTQKVNAIGVT